MMTKLKFWIAVVIVAALSVLGTALVFAFCLSGLPLDQCESVSPFVSWILSIAFFLFFIFILTPLIATFIGLPYMLGLVPRSREKRSTSTKPDGESFFIIREWADYE